MNSESIEVFDALAQRENMHYDKITWLKSMAMKLDVPDEKHNIDVETCEVMKKLYSAGMSYREISNIIQNVTKSGVAYHVKGNCTHSRSNSLCYSECGWIRVHARNGMSTKALADKYDVCAGTIRKHLKGECNHEDGILPLTEDEMLDRKSSLANYRE